MLQLFVAYSYKLLGTCRHARKKNGRSVFFCKILCDVTQKRRTGVLQKKKLGRHEKYVEIGTTLLSTRPTWKCPTVIHTGWNPVLSDFFSSLFLMFISCASRPSPTYGRLYRPRLLCVHLPAGVCIFWHYAPLRYLGPWRLFHIFPVPAVISSGRFIHLCLPYWYEFLNPPGLDSVFSFSIGRKDGGYWSVLGPLLSCTS